MSATQAPLVTVTQLDCPHARCMAGVYNVLRTLPFAGIWTDSDGQAKDGITLQIWADTRTIPPLPCIAVTIDGLTDQEDEDGSGTEVNAVIYPVNVLFLNREPWEDHTLLPRWLNWRHVAMEQFRDLSRLAEVPECVDIRLQPRPILEPNRMSPSGDPGNPYQSKMSGFTVLCHCTIDRIKETVNP